MDVRGVRTGRAHSSGMLGGWWQGWSQARLVLLEGRSDGAGSLLGDVGRLVAGVESGTSRAAGGPFAVGWAHSLGILSGWWQVRSQARLVLLEGRSQLGVLTPRGC
jgi:hypothetical protein